MSALPKFKEAQYGFAAHLRDPANQPAPEGIEDRRMKIYRDLFFNNVSGLMAQTFPVLNQLLSEEKWLRTIRDFYAHYQCHTPLFTELPKEFLDWLSNHREAEADDPAYLLELAHYEWVELALSLAPDVELAEEVHRYGDLMNTIPVMSPLAWSLSYHFPVHQISPSFQPEAPGEQPTCLVVYRNREDEIGFIETNPVTVQLLALLANNLEERKTGDALLSQLAEQLPQFPEEAVRQGGLQTLEQLRQKDIVLGTLAED
ncbi:MAG: putative DNA-binding domain-containing protein [Gammaproteobacteria bacterium]|nr:putative DNA-binding domain-containing protein [Gammaproteobacteria bacterium]